MPPFTLRRFAEPVSLADWAELQAEARRLEVLVLHACSLDTLAGLPSAPPALIELNLSSNNLSSLATVGRRGMASPPGPGTTRTCSTPSRPAPRRVCFTASHGASGGGRCRAQESASELVP